MKPDIKALAFEKKFGDIETAVYADRSLIGGLVALLAEKNGDVRSGVLNLLSRVGFDYPKETRPHLPVLIALLDDPDMFVKIDAANAVGNLGFSFKDAAAAASPKLKALLNHEQSLVRQEAAYAMGNIGLEGQPAFGNVWVAAQALAGGGKKEGILSTYDKTGVALFGP